MKRALAILVGAAVSSCGAAAPPPPRPPAVHTAKTPAPAAPADAFRDARPASGTPAEIHYPAVERARLDSGLTVYAVRRPAGVVTMSFVARGGASRVPLGKSGLAALTARMMTEGTRSKGSLALAEAVESLGTTLEHSAGRDFVRLGLTTRREDLESGLTLLSEVIQKPAFSAKELERVRAEWLDGIEAERQSPSRLSVLVGLRLLYGMQAGAPVSGSRHDVRSLRTSDLVDFHRQSFASGNSALIVIGDVSLEDVKKLASRLFQSLPRAPAAPSAAVVPAVKQPHSPLVIVDRPGAVQSALFIVQPFPDRHAPGYEARELLSTLFGGFFTSRLNMNLREEHAYTYGARSLDMATERWGAFALMTSVQTEVTGPALGEAEKELTRLRDPNQGHPIDASEVAMARTDRKQDLGTTLADTSEVADRVEELFVHDLPDDYYAKYPVLLDGIDAAAVTAEARRLNPERSITVIVGDRKVIEPALAPRTAEPVPEDLTD